MPVTAKLNYLRIAPRKVRLAANLIKKKKVEEAQTILNFTTKRAAKQLLKLLNSAVANAHSSFQLEPDNLYISKITVDEGPKLKRWRPRARGQAYEIQKKTSHITIVLDEIKKKTKTKKKKAQKKEDKRRKEVFGVEKITEKKIAKEEKITDEAKETPKETAETPFVKQRPEEEIKKPKSEKGIRRIFRRKSF